MRRRQFIRVVAAVGLWLGLCGHSPYQQWDVYRKARLVIVVSGAQTDAVRAANALAALYAKHLPQSRATVARAKDGNDLMRLIASKQLDVALILERDAGAAFRGEPPFADNGKVPLRVLAQVGDHVLVCRDDLPAASGFMLTETAAEHWKEIEPAIVAVAGSRGPRPQPTASVPLHAGAAEYFQAHQ